MRAIRMTAKKPGQCKHCRGSIRPGTSIVWARGVGAWHQDCAQAERLESLCTSCSGRGCDWKGTPCRSCDGTGSKRVQDFAKAGGHKPAHDDPGYVEGGNYVADRTDLDYEDDCARRCGL